MIEYEDFEHMGDRWYLQQKGPFKQKRKLKKDYVSEINEILKSEINGLDKCTIETLDNLLTGIKKWQL